MMYLYELAWRRKIPDFRVSVRQRPAFEALSVELLDRGVDVRDFMAWVATEFPQPNVQMFSSPKIIDVYMASTEPIVPPNYVSEVRSLDSFMAGGALAADIVESKQGEFNPISLFIFAKRHGEDADALFEPAYREWRLCRRHLRDELSSVFASEVAELCNGVIAGK